MRWISQARFERENHTAVVSIANRTGRYARLNRGCIPRIKPLDTAHYTTQNSSALSEKSRKELAQQDGSGTSSKGSEE